MKGGSTTTARRTGCRHRFLPPRAVTAAALAIVGCCRIHHRILPTVDALEGLRHALPLSSSGEGMAAGVVPRRRLIAHRDADRSRRRGRSSPEDERDPARNAGNLKNRESRRRLADDDERRANGRTEKNGDEKMKADRNEDDEEYARMTGSIMRPPKDSYNADDAIEVPERMTREKEDESQMKVSPTKKQKRHDEPEIIEIESTTREEGKGAVVDAESTNGKKDESRKSKDKDGPEAKNENEDGGLSSENGSEKKKIDDMDKRKKKKKDEEKKKKNKGDEFVADIFDEIGVPKSKIVNIQKSPTYSGNLAPVGTVAIEYSANDDGIGGRAVFAPNVNGLDPACGRRDDVNDNDNDNNNENDNDNDNDIVIDIVIDNSNGNGNDNDNDNDNDKYKGKDKEKDKEKEKDIEVVDALEEEDAHCLCGYCADCDALTDPDEIANCNSADSCVFVGHGFAKPHSLYLKLDPRTISTLDQIKVFFKASKRRRKSSSRWDVDDSEDPPDECEGGVVSMRDEDGLFLVERPEECAGDDRGVGTEVSIDYTGDGEIDASIHSSCSVPLYAGMAIENSPFVIEGYCLGEDEGGGCSHLDDGMTDRRSVCPAPPIGLTTDSPTEGPSAGPTAGPTRSPSVSPTTMSPSLSPSVSPTTRSPSLSPTSLSPTMSPTTLPPSFSPTTPPPTTAQPTAEPTLLPSLGPIVRMPLNTAPLARSRSRENPEFKLDPTSPLVAYTSDDCGPRGRDAYFNNRDQCPHGYLVVEERYGGGGTVAVVDGCRYFSFQAFECLPPFDGSGPAAATADERPVDPGSSRGTRRRALKHKKDKHQGGGSSSPTKLSFDPSSTLTGYISDDCGPRGKNALADLEGCEPNGHEKVVWVPWQDGNAVAEVDGCAYFSIEVYECLPPMEGGVSDEDIAPLVGGSGEGADDEAAYVESTASCAVVVADGDCAAPKLGDSFFVGATSESQFTVDDLHYASDELDGKLLLFHDFNGTAIGCGTILPTI